MSAPRWLTILSLLAVALAAPRLSTEEPRIIEICGFTAKLQEELRCWKPGALVRIEFEGLGTRLVYSPDGKHVAVSRFHRGTEILDGASGRLIRRLPEGRSLAVAFSPDGEFLVTGGWDYQRLCLWELATGKLVGHFGPKEEKFYATSADFSPNGKLLAVCSESSIHLWDLTSGQRVGCLRSEAPTGEIRFAPDGKSLVSYSRHELRIWDVANREKLGHSRTLYQQQFVLRGCCVGPGQIDGVVFSPDGQRIYFGVGIDNQVQAATVRSGKLQPVTAQTEEATSFALSPDGRTLALGGSDGTIRLIELLTGQVCARLPGHQHEVLPIAFSPDGRRLASAGADQAMQFWDLTRVVPVPPGPLAGEALATAWIDLGGDSEKAFQAMQLLSGEQGLRFLQAKMQPRFIAEAEVRRWIADLDSRDFSTRQAATEALEKLGHNVTPALRQAAAGQTTLEVRLRLEQLLALAEQTPRCAEDLREHRVIELLERLGTPAARQLLQKLAGGSPTAQLTELAKSALAARQ